MVPMAVAAVKPAPEAPSAGIGALAERYDPDAIDLPGGAARVRLQIDGGRVWDAVLTRRKLSLQPPRDGTEPDATLTADAATWRRIAADVRGGMDAFRRGKLRDPRQPPRGRGLPGRHERRHRGARGSRFESVRTRKSGTLSILSAGAGKKTLICAHGLGGTKASFLPTVAALADALPRRRASTCPASASPTSRSAPPTTPPTSRGRCSS